MVLLPMGSVVGWVAEGQSMKIMAVQRRGEQ